VKPARRRWIIAALVAIGAGFAVRFGWTFPWTQTLDTLADADWALLGAAGLLNIVSLMAKGSAWHLLLRRLAPLRAGTAQAATFVGAAVNSVSVSVSGEAARAQMANRRDGVPFTLAVGSLVVSRVVEAIGLVVFLALAFILLPPWAGARPIGFILGGVAVAVMLGYHLVLGKRPLPALSRISRFARGGLFGPVALATLSWVAQWFTYHWSIVATHTTITPAASLSALVLANLAGILRLTPGNIGVMQGSLVLGMQAFRIPAANALAAGLALQAVQVLPILAIGLAIGGARSFRFFAARRAGAV
jgi:uncharacterized membrane protein YbhN (UPF0104 family)